jgi:hypothetical protein
MKSTNSEQHETCAFLLSCNLGRTRASAVVVRCKCEDSPTVIKFLTVLPEPPTNDPFSDTQFEPRLPIRILGTEASLAPGEGV